MAGGWRFGRVTRGGVWDIDSDAVGGGSARGGGGGVKQHFHVTGGVLGRNVGRGGDAGVR